MFRLLSIPSIGTSPRARVREADVGFLFIYFPSGDNLTGKRRRGFEYRGQMGTASLVSLVRAARRRRGFLLDAEKKISSRRDSRTRFFSFLNGYLLAIYVSHLREQGTRNSALGN